MMRIHAIQTGSVAVTRSWREGVGHGRRRRLNTLLDREWTEPLPIHAFAIEHPEGVIVVDAGETARVAEPGYFPRWQPYFRFAVRERVEPEQEIGPQLARLGIGPHDVRRVVMTHLHTDHAGGLHHFPDREILVSRAELEFAAGRRGRLRAYTNARWPAWFDPTPIDLRPEPVGPFPRSLRLTEAGDVVLVPLPGHTPGQVGVLVQDADHTVLIAGDASYTQEAMLRGAIDGVGADEDAQRLTHERIRAYAAAVPTVYLVAHDAQTAEPSPSGGASRRARRWSSRDRVHEQRGHPPTHRGGLRLRLRSAAARALELGGPRRSRDVRTGRRGGLDLRPGARASERVGRERDRGHRP
jgi:glyoxylase-like metal-dependent hydrolase (beta-lactamase superfamily II)